MGGPQDEDKFTSLLKCIKKTGKFYNQEIGIDVAYCMKNYDQFDETGSEDQNKEEEENSSNYKILLPIFIVTVVCQLLGVYSNETDLSNDSLTEETKNILRHELDGIEEAPIQKPCLCALPEISMGSSKDLTSHDTIGLSQSVSQLTVKEAVNKIECGLQNLTSNEHIEPTGAKLILKVGGEEYNLKSKEDLQRWKERTFALKPNLNGSHSLPTEMSRLLPESSNHLSNTLRSISSSSSASITIVTSAKAKSANCIDNISNEFKFDENLELDTAEGDQKEFHGDNDNLRKARTDINIHDPLKPIPTVLEHPIVDKNGKKLKRIFIPGRGWVASKVLESEKQELYGSISNVSTD
ncbi:hypothetical protein WICPIJ_006258 [Wickerhamomyces pijperi]|uniref:Uncharacterized protein n=1 Tax=Wickerhamomyces pijperi TaxID=599730 RepID=A0A9P8Q4T6_WICPI|nr:hypothetical protein WICPIJ_006258 [Wickerhamomyces pijperi]